LIISLFSLSLSSIFSGCLNINTGHPDNTAVTETLNGVDSASSTIDANPPEKGFEEIPVEQAYEIFVSGKDYLFIDVRLKESYDKSHIKGAINIPVSGIKENLDKVTQNNNIIVYCSGSGCDIGSIAANILVQSGFTGVYVIGGLGILEWIEKGYPVE